MGMVSRHGGGGFEQFWLLWHVAFEFFVILHYCFDRKNTDFDEKGGKIYIFVESRNLTWL